MPNGSNGIAMSQEAVNALRNLATALPEATEDAKQAAEMVKSSFDEKKELLGPHTNEIQDILECIDDAQNSGKASIVKVQIGLVKAAARLQAIISGGLTGNVP